LPFFFSPNTLHSHKFNCVLFKHYLSVPFLIWRPQATSVLGVFPCSPISNCWEKRFQCSVLTKCSHEWRPFHFTLYGLTDSRHHRELRAPPIAAKLWRSGRSRYKSNFLPAQFPTSQRTVLA
jgi:hypothetical protein